jgi:hypothetical protein
LKIGNSSSSNGSPIIAISRTRHGQGAAQQIRVPQRFAHRHAGFHMNCPIVVGRMTVTVMMCLDNALALPHLHPWRVRRALALWRCRCPAWPRSGAAFFLTR